MLARPSRDVDRPLTGPKLLENEAIQPEIYANRSEITLDQQPAAGDDHGTFVNYTERSLNQCQHDILALPKTYDIKTLARTIMFANPRFHQSLSL